MGAARCRTVQGYATLGQTGSRVLGAHVRTASAAPWRRIGKRARAATGRHALLLRPLAD